MAFQVRDLMVTLEPTRLACPTASADCPTASATMLLLTCPGQSVNQTCTSPSGFDGVAGSLDERSHLRQQLAEANARLN
ncbi:MAG: hypothetical protein ACJ75H_15995 [Thermoanaerobaculia bacterium]